MKRENCCKKKAVNFVGRFFSSTSDVSGGFENTALNTELLDVEEGKKTKRGKQEKETIGETRIYNIRNTKKHE